jgi:hypothetical protein
MRQKDVSMTMLEGMARLRTTMTLEMAAVPLVLIKKQSTLALKSGMRRRVNIKRITHIKTTLETSTNGILMANQVKNPTLKLIKKPRNSFGSLKGNRGNILINSDNMKNNGLKDPAILDLSI